MWQDHSFYKAFTCLFLSSVTCRWTTQGNLNLLRRETLWREVLFPFDCCLKLLSRILHVGRQGHLGWSAWGWRACQVFSFFMDPRVALAAVRVEVWWWVGQLSGEALVCGIIKSLGNCPGISKTDTWKHWRIARIPKSPLLWLCWDNGNVLRRELTLVCGPHMCLLVLK